jgi:hypothetical protein
LEVFSKKVKLFSGNLDGRKLNELLKKYGSGRLPPQVATSLSLLRIGAIPLHMAKTCLRRRAEILVIVI